jgi:xylulokinase
MALAGGGLVAGVDSSTQSTKVLVVDPETGRIVGEGKAPHPVTGSDGARESDPEAWWGALRAALAQTGAARRIGAIAVGAQQHGLVCLAADGRPLRPAILWNDTRSGPDAARLIDELGGPEPWATGIGTVPVPSLTATRWAWLRRVEPDAARRTAAIRLPHDYLTERLTGRAVTDRGDASGTGWWSTLTETYVDAVLALPSMQLDPRLLPAVLGPSEAAGTIRRSVAAELGLGESVIVGPGTGDNMAAALGLGLRPGVPVLSLGTSGTTFVVSERRAADPTGIVAGFADASGRFLPLACTLNCTLAVDRVATWLSLDRDDVAPSGGLVVLPFFDGERTPNLPEASGLMIGLRHDTAPGAILMATYEGALAALLDALEQVGRCSSGIDPHAPLVVIGGGARGLTWQRAAARLAGRRLRVPRAAELVALGAAVQATMVLTGEAPEAIAERWGTQSGTTVDPDEGSTDTLVRIRAARTSAASSGLFRRSFS